MKTAVGSPSCPFLATALLNGVVRFRSDTVPQLFSPYLFRLELGRDTDYRFLEELVESTAR
jgi:hypothetical protein